MRKLVLIPFIFVCLAGAAPAADFPDHPIRFIVPQAAGSATDNVARILASVIGPELGQPVIVDEFQIEVYRRGALDEVQLLLEIDEQARGPATVGETVARVAEALRRDIGIRIDVAAVPARSLPRYELKARRVVRRADGSR